MAADIVAWPCRRMFGCRMMFDDWPPATPAARGFGLLELFWWVGMAAAGCWLLRAMLENVLGENAVIMLVVLVMLATIIPPGLAGSVAGMRARHWWTGLLLSVVIAAAYGAVLGGIVWTATSIAQVPQNRLLAYVSYVPFEAIVVAAAVTAIVTFANAWGLRSAGARLVGSLPSSRSATAGANRA